MSAISQISAHADYRRSDYIFPRAQSRELSQLPWEDRAPALRSWGNVLIPAATAAAGLAVALAALS